MKSSSGYTLLAQYNVGTQTYTFNVSIHTSGFMFTRFTFELTKFAPFTTIFFKVTLTVKIIQNKYDI